MIYILIKKYLGVYIFPLFGGVMERNGITCTNKEK